MPDNQAQQNKDTGDDDGDEPIRLLVLRESHLKFWLVVAFRRDVDEFVALQQPV